MARVDRNFGMNLRAARLGFRWSASRGGYIRITDEGNDQFLVECCPANAVPVRSISKRDHFVWDERGNGDDILGHIECLRMVKRIRRHFSFLVDRDGVLVRTDHPGPKCQCLQCTRLRPGAQPCPT